MSGYTRYHSDLEFEYDETPRPKQSWFAVTVLPGQGVLEMRAGQPTVTLAPGRHRKRRRASYELVDLRERLDQIATQEIATADGVSVKVSAVLRHRVVDAVRFREVAANPVAGVYLAAQMAMREAMLAIAADDVLGSARSLIGQAATAAAREVGAEVGVEVSEVRVKDLMLPAELRAAAADLVAGRQRALVQLEAARAETAALRSLANGAKLLDEHPALAQLRLVQALPMGSTVELKQ